MTPNKIKYLKTILVPSGIFVIMFVCVLAVKYNIFPIFGINFTMQNLDPEGYVSDPASFWNFVYLLLFIAVGVISMFIAAALAWYRSDLLVEDFKLMKIRNQSELNNDQIRYLNGFSWLALITNPVWAIVNKLYWWSVPMMIVYALGILEIFFLDTAVGDILGFLRVIVILLSLFIVFYLGKFGRRLAWEKGWHDFAAFKKRQTQVWRIFIILVIIYLVFFGLITVLFLNNNLS